MPTNEEQPPQYQEDDDKDTPPLDTPTDLMVHIHRPDTKDVTLKDLKPIKDEEIDKILDEGRKVLEFTNVNKDLGFGNLNDKEILIVNMLQNFIAFELRKGLWRIASHDIQQVNSILAVSRSRNGFGYTQLFKRTIEKIFSEKKQKTGMFG